MSSSAHALTLRVGAAWAVRTFPLCLLYCSSFYILHYSFKYQGFDWKSALTALSIQNLRITILGMFILNISCGCPPAFIVLQIYRLQLSSVHCAILA